MWQPFQCAGGIARCDACSQGVMEGKGGEEWYTGHLVSGHVVRVIMVSTGKCGKGSYSLW